MYHNKHTTIYFNGKMINASDAEFDLYSQSLHYGYAVFEGIRAYKTINGNTAIFKAKTHYERLKNSALAIGIPYEFNQEELITATYQLLADNNLQNAYIRPLIFCPPNMALAHAQSSEIIISAWEWDALLGNNLLNVMTSSYQRPNPKGFKIEAKVTGHYVNSILACQEAKNKGYDEALLLDINDYVAEGPGANVFFEKDGILITPPLGHILPGITRATVLEICQELSIPTQERLFTVAELKTAHTAFFCGTAAEIIGWKSLDDQVFKGEWKGSLSEKIQQCYLQKVLSDH